MSSFRVVVIDPSTKTVTEEQLQVQGTYMERLQTLRKFLGTGSAIPLMAPVRNGETGDTFFTSACADKNFIFLDEAYGGKSTIVGRAIAADAAVPLERVISQVRWPKAPPRKVTRPIMTIPMRMI